MQTANQWEIQDFAGVLRRRWRSITAWAVIGAIFGVGLFILLPRSYSASSSVLVRPSAADTGAIAGGRTTTGVVNLDTEATILKSSEVLVTAAEAISLPWAELKQAMSVNVPPNSAVMEIRYLADSPQAAATGANAIAEAYLAGRLKNATASLVAQAKPLEDALKETRSALRAARNDAVRDVLQQQVQDIQADLRNIMAIAPTAGRILQPAIVPTQPTSPDAVLVVGGSTAVFLLLGIGMAFFRESRDKTIHTRRQAAALAGLDDLDSDAGRNSERTLNEEAMHLARKLALRGAGPGQVVVHSIGGAESHSVVEALRASLQVCNATGFQVEASPDLVHQPVAFAAAVSSADVVVLAAAVGVDHKGDMVEGVRSVIDISTHADLELLAWRPRSGDSSTIKSPVSEPASPETSTVNRG